MYDDMVYLCSFEVSITLKSHNSAGFTRSHRQQLLQTTTTSHERLCVNDSMTLVDRESRECLDDKVDLIGY